MSSRYLNIAIPVILFAIIAYFIPDIPFYDFDTLCWKTWAVHDFQAGLADAYNDPGSFMRTNYLPLFHYVLYIYGLICGSEERIIANIGYLKLVTLAVDWLGLWYMYKWIDKKVAFYWMVILGLLNIAYAYNSLIWGQVDGISATLVFISAYYGFNRKTILSTVFFVLAVNMKLQAIIFFPFWAFFYLQYALERRNARSFLLPLVAFAVTQFILLVPFLGSIERVKAVVFESVDQYAYVSANAFNYWYIVMGDKVWHLPDSGNYIGPFTYKQFGLTSFFAFSFLVLCPMLYVLYKRLLPKLKKPELTRQQVWLISALIALGFFFFNTQMHERYSHPAFIFITAYALFTKDFIPYIIFSVAYFLNLEKVGRVIGLNNYHTFLFDHVFIGCLFGVLLAYLFVRLCLSFRQKHLQ